MLGEINATIDLLHEIFCQKVFFIGPCWIFEDERTKQPSESVIRRRYSENMQQIYRRTSMPKCDFMKSHFGIGVLL